MPVRLIAYPRSHALRALWSKARRSPRRRSMLPAQARGMWGADLTKLSQIAGISNKARSMVSTMARASPWAVAWPSSVRGLVQYYACFAARRGHGHHPADQSLQASAAAFEIGMSEYDFAFVFMPLTEAQAYFNRAVTAIEIYTDDPDRIDLLSPIGHRCRPGACDLHDRLADATPLRASGAM